MKSELAANILELIRRTSACLPADVAQVLDLHAKLEEKGSMADLAMDLVGKNIALARGRSAPICQDTGTITFFIHNPVHFNQLQLEEICQEAVVRATAMGYLRQNSVDSVTGLNSGNNLGPGSPVFHWHQHTEDFLDIRLILKGGGCENMSAQYSLPATLNGKRCDRDLNGVRIAILDSVWQAQGKGCGPGFLGVCIGGDRASGFEFAKEQLLRLTDDANPDIELAALEARILQEANQLDIGPMGFGGKLTVGACKIGVLNRLPASYFVTVAYMCWAYRRRGLLLTPEGQAIRWLYQEASEDLSPKEETILVSLAMPGGKTRSLKMPLTEADVRSLKAGDMVFLSGRVYTGRDEVHKYLFKGGDVPQLKGGVIYHCGPVVLEKAGEYQVIAAGPTTSIREEPYQAEIISRYGIKGVIGKGGMGAKTLEACKKSGCVYFHAIGGAAQIYATCVEKVYGVFLKEKFGSPEAVWELEVKDFPVVVTMDAHGHSLHQEITDHSQSMFQKIMS
ncbi:MAG: fumarate hydratase [Gemmataceae bacterium]|nr:fumarate hydratase [Gemmataceae bacterium]